MNKCFISYAVSPRLCDYLFIIQQGNVSTFVTMVPYCCQLFSLVAMETGHNLSIIFEKKSANHYKLFCKQVGQELVVVVELHMHLCNQ